jgi:transcriptional regulator with XRE-family HTH domain
MDTTAKEIGKKLKTARRAKDMTQTELADLVGLDVTSYARIERGEVNVSLDNFIKILKVLNLKLNDIIPQ